MTKQLTITTANVANQIGTNDRVERSTTLALHKAYVKMDDVAQAADRREWCINYVAGNMCITVPKAEAVIDTPRTERTAEQQRSYNRARDQYGYHVVRAEPTQATNKADPTLRVIGQAIKGANSKQLKEVLALLERMGLIVSE